MKIRSPVVSDSFVGDLTGNASTATQLTSAGHARPEPVQATGASQTVAHGLGAVPSIFFPVIVGGHDGAGGSGDKFPALTGLDVDATNITFTLTEGAMVTFYVTL